MIRVYCWWPKGMCQIGSGNKSHRREVWSVVEVRYYPPPLNCGVVECFREWNSRAGSLQDRADCTDVNNRVLPTGWLLNRQRAATLRAHLPNNKVTVWADIAEPLNSITWPRTNLNYFALRSNFSHIPRGGAREMAACRETKYLIALDKSWG
jgi:hypothetical protein